MRDLLIYFGLLDFIAISLAVVVVIGLGGWLLGRRWARVHQTQAQMDELLAALPHGALVLQANGQVVAANAEAHQLWGGADAHLGLARALGDLVGDVHDHAGVSIRTLVAPSGLQLQVRVVGLDSGLVLFTLSDLTARRQQEAFYRNFISNVSHELKTPLTVIQGHVAAMGEGMADDDPRQTSRRIVAQEATRLTQLVDNLLLLSRLEMPDFSLDRRLVNVEAVVEDAILQVSDLAEAHGIALSLQRDGSLPRILVDRSRLKQVLLNLLDNAIKYNHQGGAVTVHLDADARHVRIKVQDTGEGIPAQDLPHIFTKMYRVARREGHYVEGSGLGLAIVQHIVKQHGGSIAVESQVGQGSTFIVILPRSSGETDPQNGDLPVTFA